MSKIDLTSSEWNDLVFEGRNKNYGAYDMRQNSNKRHITALIIILAFALLVFYLPALIKSIVPKKDDMKMTEVTELSKLPPAEEKKEDQHPIEDLLPPPPPLKSTMKFTPPVIKKDTEVADEEEMKTQEEVLKSDLTISIKDVQGTDEQHGQDIADLAKTVIQEKPVEEKPYVTVEQMPQYPGGETEMRKYIAKSTRYPEVARENGVQGRVVVRFVVSKTGKIENVEVIKSLDPACDKEALRVVSSMPNWTPGRQNGAAVSVYFVVPISFTLGS